MYHYRIPSTTTEKLPTSVLELDATFDFGDFSARLDVGKHMLITTVKLDELRLATILEALMSVAAQL